jgi:hypothetical protein
MHTSDYGFWKSCAVAKGKLLMASRIEYDEPMIGIKPRPRRPRIERGDHLAFIRQLPCVICGARPVDAAHLRSANSRVGKRAVGAGEKPNDVWVTPLCRLWHHSEQHSMNELTFWLVHGITNPFQLALALYAASGDMETAEQIIAEHQRRPM